MKAPAFRFLQHDITQPWPLDGPAEVVFHLASPATPAHFAHLAVETLAAGTLGTMRALDWAIAAGSTFLLASTSEIYGCPEVHPQPETYWGHVNPVGPRSMYDEAKRAAEAIAVAYEAQRGACVRIVRIFNTYGPGMAPGDGRVVPRFIDRALANAPITVFGDGSQTRSLCHVSDLVDGLLLVADARVSQPINLGHPRETSMLELAKLIRHLCASSSAIDFAPLPDDDPPRRCPDVSRARDLLDWWPKVGLEEGLADTIAVRMRRGELAVALGADG